MKKKMRSLFQTPKWRYGGFSLLLMLLLAAALITAASALDALESANGWRRDYSFNGITTQSETTKKALGQLETPVHIYALFPKGDEDQVLMELLNRYKAASPLVTWEQTDLSLNPGLAVKFQKDEATALTTDGLVVYCEKTDRFKILDAYSFISLGYNLETGGFDISAVNYEKAITEAILYVTQEVTPKVRLLTGHGELGLAETAFYVDFLRSNNFDVAQVNLTSQELAGDELIMILSPQKDLAGDELEALNAFAQAGGSFLIACDFSDDVESMPNYLSLLRAYGVVPRNGLVVAGAEENGTYYNSQIFIRPYMQVTDATQDLVAGGMDSLILAASRAFETPAETDNSLTVETVLFSGYQAYLRQVDGENYDISQQDGDPLGPFSLALLSRRVQESGNITRMLALGSSSLFTNSQIYAITYASEFMLEMTQYLLNTQTVSLDIMAKAAGRPGLSAGGQGIGVALIVALPLMVALAALWVLLPRRHR